MGEQLSGWRTRTHQGKTRFTRSEGSRSELTLRGWSCLDPQLPVAAEIGSRNADNDGTFPTAPVSVVMFLVAAVAPDGSLSKRKLTRAEATAWRNTLLPEIDHCYALENPEDPSPGSASGWYFVLFRGPDNELLTAPYDFDWVKHRVGFRGLRVSLIDRDGQPTETVYENRRFPPFYQPYTESRGRYWDLAVTEPPTSAGISRCFAALSKAIARRGAIADSIRPVSLRWKHDNVADLILRYEDTGRCYQLETIVPTDSDLDSGNYLLPAHFGTGLPVKLSSPEQYAAGAIAHLRDMGVNEIPNQGQVTTCP
ncbi:hypothetical protein ACWESM_16315 [Nocardia sp. NPDC003999]